MSLPGAHPHARIAQFGRAEPKNWTYMYASPMSNTVLPYGIENLPSIFSDSGSWRHLAVLFICLPLSSPCKTGWYMRSLQGAVPPRATE